MKFALGDLFFAASAAGGAGAQELPAPQPPYCFEVGGVKSSAFRGYHPRWRRTKTNVRGYHRNSVVPLILLQPDPHPVFLWNIN